MGVLFFVRVKLLRVFSLGKAITAVYRAIFGRLEGHLAFCTAISANSVIESLGASCSILASIAAGFASLGLVLEALFSIKFMLTGGEHKFGAGIEPFSPFRRFATKPFGHSTMIIYCESGIMRWKRIFR